MSESFEQMVDRVTKETGCIDLHVPNRIAFATRIRDELAKGQEPDCWAVLTSNGSKLVSPDEARGLCKAYPLYTHTAPIPADMVMVPREPTQNMIMMAVETSGFSNRYKAMIAAYEKEQGK